MEKKEKETNEQKINNKNSNDKVEIKNQTLK